VSSNSGSVREARFIYEGEHESGWIIRLKDGRIARLDPTRIDWSTHELLEDDGSPLWVAGDEFALSTPANTVQGHLLKPITEEVSLRVDDDWDMRLPLASVKTAAIRFRAAGLKTGDRFEIKSRSGTEYVGTVIDSTADSVKVVSEGGEPLTLRLRRLDLDTLFVLVPITLTSPGHAA
jgi:hypothetical protein